MADNPTAYAAPVELRIGGVPVQTLGYGRYSSLSVQTKYSSTGGGLHALNCTLALPPNFSHPAVRIGATLEAFKGGYRIGGTAIVGDVNYGTGEVTADGLYRRAQYFGAFVLSNGTSGTVAPTTNVRAAVAAGNARGLGWNGTGNLPDITLRTDDDTPLNTIADVLNEFCNQQNQRWGLDATNTPYVTPDPTTPALALRPGVPSLPTTADDYSSRVTVKYVANQVANTAPGAQSGDMVDVYGYASAVNAAAPLGVREEFEDITSAGKITQAAATGYAQQFADANAARTTYAASIAPDEGLLTDLGGNPVAPYLLMAGQRVRHYGVRDTGNTLSFGATTEWVIGGTTWEPSSDNPLVLDPVDLAPRTVVQVQAATTDATKKGFS